LRFPLDPEQRTVYQESEIFAETLQSLVLDFFPALELEHPACWRRSSGPGARPRRPNGSEQHTGVPDGRLHASTERIDVACGFHLRRGHLRKGPGRVLETFRKA